MFLELIFGLIALLFLLDYFSKKRSNEILRKSNIRGPKPMPLIGNALELRGVTIEDIFEFKKRNKQKYGKVYRMWILNKLNVIVSDVKYAEAILTSQSSMPKDGIYNFLQPWLGTGLLLSTGKKWHTRRKIITPTFHFKILEQFVEIFDQQTTVMVKKLYERADGKTAINIFPIVCLAALDIITETAMGVKVHAQDNPDIEYVHALENVVRIITNRFLVPWKRITWLFQLLASSEARKVEKCIKVMHDFTNKVIEERRALLEKSIKEGNYEPSNMTEDMGLKKRMALLDVLLQATQEGNPLSNEDIREEVETFMFGGHDTTTSGISFCLYLIARHPEVQRKIMVEIEEVIGVDKDKPISYQELKNLKYLECVIKESLRLYPAVPGIGRKTVNDLVLDDITIPAGTNISIPFFIIFRDPDNFANPDDFIPERFFDENTIKMNPFAYTPFSAGSRNCIGQKYAMLEMKSAISKLLRHFELLPLGPNVKLIPNIILRSVTGVHIGLKPRAGSNQSA